MRPVVRGIALVGLVAGALSCSSSNPSNPADSGASGSIFGCKADVRAQTYSANMQKPGMAGAFTFATFPPQATWAGWAVGVLPSMPDHGHRSPAQPMVTPNSGTCRIEPLYIEG
jgi:hypothetical protein